MQRGTMLAWSIPSPTNWARIIFVLLDCQPLNIGGNHLGGILGPGQHEVPPSENGVCIRAIGD